MSISLSKWPMLPTMAWCFMAPMCAAVMMSLLPVAVMMMSATGRMSSSVVTWNPSMAACRAQIGSTSVTTTRAPWPASDCAQPLPTSPKPQTTATLPPISTSVARLMPSTSEWRQPYLLSNLDLVTESFTLMAGKRSSPFLAMSASRWTPVVVSSVTPLMPLATEVQRPASSVSVRPSSASTTANSSESADEGSGTAPAFSNSTPLCTSSVASPPSSRIMFGPAVAGPGEGLLGAPPVLLERLALPREHRHALRVVDRAVGPDRDRGGGVVLRGEDVAAGPADPGAQGDQGLDEDGGLHGHVQRTGDAGALQGPADAVLGPHGHEAGHLVLGQLDLLAAELGQGEVGHLERWVGAHVRSSFCRDGLTKAHAGRANLLRAIRRRRNARAPTSVGGRYPLQE